MPGLWSVWFFGLGHCLAVCSWDCVVDSTGVVSGSLLLVVPCIVPLVDLVGLVPLFWLFGFSMVYPIVANRIFVVFSGRNG